jgi:hypothetical protein
MALTILRITIESLNFGFGALLSASKILSHCIDKAAYISEEFAQN